MTISDAQFQDIKKDVIEELRKLNRWDKFVNIEEGNVDNNESSAKQDEYSEVGGSTVIAEKIHGECSFDEKISKFFYKELPEAKPKNNQKACEKLIVKGYDKCVKGSKEKKHLFLETLYSVCDKNKKYTLVGPPDTIEKIRTTNDRKNNIKYDLEAIGSNSHRMSPKSLGVVVPAGAVNYKFVISIKFYNGDNRFDTILNGKFYFKCLVVSTCFRQVSLDPTDSYELMSD